MCQYEILTIVYGFRLQTKEYSARYQFTGKGKLKITNISLQDVGTWTCYDPSTNYTGNRFGL